MITYIYMRKKKFYLAYATVGFMLLAKPNPAATYHLNQTLPD